MKMKMYSIYDRCAAAYMRPFYTQRDDEAIRSFRDLALDAQHPVGQHPEDYSLFRIGEFDDNTGSVTGENPECLTRAHELVVAAREVDGDELARFDKELN